METSPHTRGKPVAFTNLQSGARNIPAYAGKADLASTTHRAAQKHPRIRGESYRTSSKRPQRSETSPHTRGKRCATCRSFSRTRNIPAYAGKACPGVTPKKSAKKHPRIRGESSGNRRALDRCSETSPHTRGKPPALLLPECR